MPVDEGLRLEEPDAKRQRPDLAGIKGDFEVPGEEWEFVLPGTSTYKAAGAAQGQALEAQEAASAVEQEEYVDDVYGTQLRAGEKNQTARARLDKEQRGLQTSISQRIKVTRPDRTTGHDWLVCREVKAAKRPGEQLKASELFSSMPPLEAIKTLCSLCMLLGLSPKGKPLKLALWDISRAHLSGDAQRDLYVDLPPEDSRHPDD
eukprot:305769-Amphidinium_carterae.1